MGLFVNGRGHYQGWLAALLCCFVALNDDESPAERERAKTRPAAGQKTTCYDQPSNSLTALPTLLAKVDSVHDHHVFHVHSTQDDLRREGKAMTTGSLNPPITRTSSLPVPLSPIEGEEAQTPPPSRAIGSRPQRQGLVPLQLGPVVLRDLPNDEDDHTVPVSTASRQPNRHSRTESTAKLLANAAWPCSNPEQDSLLHDGIRTTRQWNPHLSPPPYVHKSASAQELHRPTLSPAPTIPAQAPIQHLLPSSASSTIYPPPSTSRPAAKLRRKRSDNPRKSTIEQEILELTTLVSSLGRHPQTSHPPSPHSHIPAIAPSMLVRARSETLETIGSAFSRPLTRHAPAHADPSSVARTPTQPRSRVPAWLSHLHLSKPAPLPDHPPEPFYKCQPPAQPQSARSLSRASSGTGTTEPQRSEERLESPSSSAPTTLSRGWHSRERSCEIGGGEREDGVGVAI